jgi:hypothetical protein
MIPYWRVLASYDDADRPGEPAMPFEYRVVPAANLASLPALYQDPGSRLQQYGADTQDAFNRMAAEGWDLVGNFAEPISGVVLFVFRRECATNPATGIKPADR